MQLRASAYFVFWFLLASCQRPSSTYPDTVRSPSAEPTTQILSVAEKRNFYRWLVSEMHEQVFLRPAKSRSDIEAWANVFAQGASIEGVYHGMVFSTEYAGMERGRANLDALRWFAGEMSNLENPLLKESDPAARKSLEKFAKDHISSSLFALKRELGERVLKEFEKLKNDRDRLSDWYSSLAIRWAGTDVSFGMSSRNRNDLEFHKTWAKENSYGLIQWELLNRVHRILNHKGGVAVVTQPVKQP